MPIAKAAHIKAAYILIDSNHLKHIDKNHNKELQNLGLNAIDFVNIIINSFTRIYKDKKTGAYYLAVYVEKYTNAAVVELSYCEKTEFWAIKTAAPFRTAFFNNKLLVWEKGAHPLK
jgi:hypothetical protein